jgi:uncharacterized membrane protein
MVRLKEKTAKLLAVVAGITLTVLYILFGSFVGWEYILGFFPILIIVVVIVGVVLWILGLSKEKKPDDQ